MKLPPPPCTSTTGIFTDMYRLCIFIYIHIFTERKHKYTSKRNTNVHTYIHTLHYTTLHYIILHSITLHYIILHSITLHYIHIYIYIMYVLHARMSLYICYMMIHVKNTWEVLLVYPAQKHLIQWVSCQSHAAETKVVWPVWPLATVGGFTTPVLASCFSWIEVSPVIQCCVKFRLDLLRIFSRLWYESYIIVRYLSNSVFLPSDWRYLIDNRSSPKLGSHL